MIDTLLIFYTKVNIKAIQFNSCHLNDKLKVLHTLKMLNLSSIRDPTNVHSAIQLIPYSF
jgi:hypothetical protein